MEFGISRGGFTLLEMIVSFGIFTVVIVTAVGAVLAINDAHIKAGNIQNIQDNLRFSLESMTKEMRSGKDFRLPSVDGCPPACPQINFTRSDNASVGYCRGNDALRKMTGTTDCSDTDCSGDGVCSSDMTDPGLVIEGLKFYVIGQGSGDGQPRITVSLRARSRDPDLATGFKLQTTVVQRERDANR